MRLKTKLLLTTLLLQFCLTFGLGIVVAYWKTHDRAPSGLVVWGQDFSGLSRTQVAAQLKEKIPKVVSFEGNNYPLNLESSYAEINKWLDKVFLSSTGFWFSDFIHSVIRPFMLISPNSMNTPNLNKEDIIAQLQILSKTINKPMHSASVAYSNGRLEKTDGEAGQELDIVKTWLKIEQEHNHSRVELVVNPVPARPDTAAISKIKDILGDYTTYFNPEDLPRTKNLRLAALSLNNHLIPPGQVFSFNNVVGERTEAAGYLPAIIFADHAMIKGDGGGICQDSSTLFQAVQQAHLRIVEKHTHTLPVSYVLTGQDATVSFGILDFCFRNDTNGYLLISARTGSNWLRIQLYGLADDLHPVLQKPNGYPIYPGDWNKDPV